MVLTIVILAVLLSLNAILAMSELAMMTSRQSRLQQAAAAGDGGAAAALKLAREPTRFLSTVQVGITLIGIFAGAFGENSLSGPVQAVIKKIPIGFVSDHADTIALVLVVLAITYFSLVLGELVPKRIAMAYPEAVASCIARPLGMLSTATAWPVKVLSVSTDGILKALRIRHREGDDVSEEDVKSIVARAASTGIFDPLEHAIFKRAFRLGDLRVRDLMVPRADIIWIDESLTAEEVRVLLGTSPFSHFPVCRGDLDKLVGVVHIKDLIAYGLLAGGDFAVSTVAQKPLFVPEATPALKLLDMMQKTRNHVAFVVDEYGGTSGLITLNDIVQTLVGSIARAGDDEPPAAVRRDDGSLLVDGRLPLHELVVTLGVSAAAEERLPDVSTTAGLVVALLGHLPTRGEWTDWEGWRLEVVDMDAKRVDQVLVRPVPP